MLVEMECVLKTLMCDLVMLISKEDALSNTDSILSEFMAFPQFVGNHGRLHCRDNANVNN